MDISHNSSLSQTFMHLELMGLFPVKSMLLQCSILELTVCVPGVSPHRNPPVLRLGILHRSGFIAPAIVILCQRPPCIEDDLGIRHFPSYSSYQGITLPIISA